MEGFPKEIIYKLESEGSVRFGDKDLQTGEIMHEDLKEENTSQVFFKKDLLTEIMKILSPTPKTCTSNSLSRRDPQDCMSFKYCPNHT